MRLALVIALATACGVEPGADGQTVGARALPIIGGAPSSEGAVVAIVAGDHAQCSGVLVGQRVVATAAHCVGAGALAVLVDGELVPVTHAAKHPKWDPATWRHDFALLLVGDQASVRPARLPAVADRAQVERGARVRLVGFGHESPDGTDEHVQRSGFARIEEVTNDELVLRADPAGACYGDSGGPVFLGSSDVVVALVTGGGQGCTGLVRAVRVDPYLADPIATYVANSELGVADTGERCLDDLSCAEGSCWFPSDVPTIGYCQRACVPGTCPAGMMCSDGDCRYPLPSPGALGSACDVASDCGAGVCATESESAPSVCAVRCWPADTDPCGGDVATRCLPNEHDPGQHACVPVEPSGCRAGHDSGLPPWCVMVLVLLFWRQQSMRRDQRVR